MDEFLHLYGVPLCADINYHTHAITKSPKELFSDLPVIFPVNVYHLFGDIQPIHFYEWCDTSRFWVWSDFFHLGNRLKLMLIFSLFNRATYHNSLIYMTPFLIGILFGFFKYNYEGKIKINSFILFIGEDHQINLISPFCAHHCVFFAGSASCVLLMAILFLNFIQFYHMSFVTNLSHIFMSLILLWCCVVSMSNYEGMNYLFNYIHSDIFKDDWNFYT